jgi:hypothetical protein
MIKVKKIKPKIFEITCWIFMRFSEPLMRYKKETKTLVYPNQQLYIQL